MISSIPVLMIQRSIDEAFQLYVFSEMVPSTSEDKLIKQKVTQRLINSYGHTKKKTNKESSVRYLKIYNKYKAMIDQGILVPDYIRDPVKRFFIKAVIDKKSWSQLIVQNGWDTLFGNQEKKAWSIYEHWITFICFKGFKNKQAYFLSSHLTKNCHSMIDHYRRSDNSLFEVKLNKLVKRSINQLNTIHYENQKNLLISIKLKQSFEQTLRRLDFQRILQCPQNSFGIDFNRWVEFLCTKFEGNRTMIKPVIYEQIFNWRSMDQRNQKPQSKTKYLQYEQKLQYIINRYTNFQASFTNQVQASLLKDLQQRNNWKIAQCNIDAVIKANRNLLNNLKHKQIGEIDLNDHRLMSDLELPFNQNSNITNFIQEEAPAIQIEIKNTFKNQYYIQKSTNDNLSDIERTDSPQKIKIQNQQQKRNIPTNSFFKYKYKNSPFQKQLQKKQRKNEQEYNNERKFFNKPELQSKVSSMYTTSKVQEDSIQIIMEQFPIKHQQAIFQNFRQYQLRRQKQISERLQNIQLASKRLDKDDDLGLSTEQNLILSLLGKAHESLQYFKRQYFSDIPQDSLQNYLAENNDIIKPMYHSLLSIVRHNQNSDTINNQNIRNMIQIILNIELMEQNQLQQEKLLNYMLSQQDMVKQFADGFDRLMKDLYSNQQPIQTEMA